ncbi:hypothetical protein MATL_G00068630 [Megalops atlanticus]|uniref:Uncharacterized protein n=1 Tax=Megalops atlanticus TaxID=7932 RepID=A0A9D3Q9E5_MEGAT|nr:hypothetical protein MATL_G00068630 [Megalops atlanticus]
MDPVVKLPCVAAKIYCNLYHPFSTSDIKCTPRFLFPDFRLGRRSSYGGSSPLETTFSQVIAGTIGLGWCLATRLGNYECYYGSRCKNAAALPVASFFSYSWLRF